MPYECSVRSSSRTSPAKTNLCPSVGACSLFGVERTISNRLVVSFDPVCVTIFSIIMLAHRSEQLLIDKMRLTQSLSTRPRTVHLHHAEPLISLRALANYTQSLQRHAHRDAVVPIIHYDRLSRDIKPHRYA